jgi:hypothetical protein
MRVGRRTKDLAGSTKRLGFETDYVTSLTQVMTTNFGTLCTARKDKRSEGWRAKLPV